VSAANIPVQPSERIRLLVVDDDPLQLRLVERALALEGFEIRSVETMAGFAAEAARYAPDIVLVDVNLPDIQPEQAIQVARDTARGAYVVLYSAWEESKLRALVKRSGADAFISKSESVLAIGPRLRALRATPAAAR
jgi:DNA-binding response OmpR family regulator